MRSNLWLAQNKDVALKDLFMVSQKKRLTTNFLEEGSKAYEKAQHFPEETNQVSWIYPWETLLLYHILRGSYSPCFHHTLTKMSVDLINRIGSHNFNVNKLSYFKETKLSSLKSDFLWFPDRI